MDFAAVVGASRLRYDDGLDIAFLSSDGRYHDYLRFKDQFTQTNGDIAVLFTADDFADPENLKAVQDFALASQLIDGVADAYSIFAVRSAAPEGGPTETLIPEPLPDKTELKESLAALHKRDSGMGRLISADRTLTVVIVTLKEPDAQLSAIEEILAGLKSAANAATADRHVQAELTGLPVLRSTVIASLFKDVWLFNVVGMAAGFLVCALALRSFSLAALVSMPTGTALLWTLGTLGFAGFSINVLSVALPALIVVLAFADSLHLTFEVRRLRISGVPEDKASLEALRRVGPACALASITTAAAFASLTISVSALIRDLGLAGVIGTLASLAAVLITHPMLFSTVAALRAPRSIFAGGAGAPPAAFDWGNLSIFALRRYRSIVAASTLLLVAAAVAYAQIRPTYSVYENLDPDEPAVTALVKLESKLVPTSTIDVPVQLGPGSQGTLDVDALARIKTVHDLAAKTLPEALVVSAQTLRREIAQGTPDDEARQINSILKSMTETQNGRFLSRDGAYGLVRANVAVHDAAAGRSMVAALERALNHQDESETAVRATGPFVVQAFISRDMLIDLNDCFLIAVGLSGLLIAIQFRSVVQGAVALVPNILPIMAVGAFLALSGWGLQYSSGVALTIAFGLAVDDTVHILNRLRLNANDGRPFDPAIIARSVQEVAPVLVITTAVLSFGIAGTLFSALPTLRYFGGILIVIFVLAIVADLLVFPAWLKAIGYFGSWRRRRVVS